MFLKINTEHTCTVCCKTKCAKKEKTIFLELQRPTNKKNISFKELFNETELMMNCDTIECYSDKYLTKNLYNFSSLKYLIILIKLTYFIDNKIVRFEVNISGFNPDEVIINETKFKTLAVCFHYNITEESAHFVCFKRIKNYWLNISDEYFCISENLNNLKDAYYLVLEKY